jgi:hypothetical protein
MRGLKIAAMVGMMLAAASSVFAVGGVLSDGQGTNWSYGDVYGQGIYYLRNFKTAGIDGAGITNIPATALQAGTVMPAVDGSAITNLPATTSMSAANLIIGTVASAIDGSGITNLAYANIPDAPAAITDYISTNATPQSKAGLLTLNGGVTAGAKVSFTPSAFQAIATGAAIASDAAIVTVAGDGGATTATIADGTVEGQLLTIRGTSDANTVQLTNSVIPPFMLGTNDVIAFSWVSGVWVEQYRRDN